MIKVSGGGLSPRSGCTYSNSSRHDIWCAELVASSSSAKQSYYGDAVQQPSDDGKEPGRGCVLVLVIVTVLVRVLTVVYRMYDLIYVQLIMLLLYQLSTSFCLSIITHNNILDSFHLVQQFVMARNRERAHTYMGLDGTLALPPAARLPSSPSRPFTAIVKAPLGTEVTCVLLIHLSLGLKAAARRLVEGDSSRMDGFSTLSSNLHDAFVFMHMTSFLSLYIYQYPEWILILEMMEMDMHAW